MKTLLTGVFLIGSLLRAQGVMAQERPTTTNFIYARPSDLTIIVNVVGHVQRPGRYEIASNIDLVNLVSLAGGPTVDGTLGDVTVSRILEEREGARRRDLHFDLGNLSSINPDELTLAPGDMVIIGRSTWSVVGEVFGVFGYLAVAATAVTGIISLSR